MTALENKEIKGITVKLLYTIIASTGVICITFMIYYNKLTMQMEKFQMQNGYNVDRIEKLEVAQNAVINQVNLNSVAIGKLQK